MTSLHKQCLYRRTAKFIDDINLEYNSTEYNLVEVLIDSDDLDVLDWSDQ